MLYCFIYIYTQASIFTAATAANGRMPFQLGRNAPSKNTHVAANLASVPFCIYLYIPSWQSYIMDIV